MQVNDLIEELGNTQALLSEKEAALAEVEQAGQELEDLREMKEDVERRERAQATVIENQAKRLDELETLYKARSSSLNLKHKLILYLSGLLAG